MNWRLVHIATSLCTKGSGKGSCTIGQWVQEKQFKCFKFRWMDKRMDGWNDTWQMGGWMDRWRCILSLRESNSAQNKITCPQIQWWRGLSECYLDRCTPEADSFRLGSFWFHSASFWGHKLKRRTEGIGSLHVARKTQANLITHIMKKRRHIQHNNNGTTAEYKVKIKPPMSIRSTSDLQQLYVY